ncbi:hypothetical protein DIPPA_27871 [Diplonema papillatum]|nr:hypothetical protein DIPPA_27871 [Diplonema papillatum]
MADSKTVTQEEVLATLEGLRNNNRLVGYVVYDASGRHPKKVAADGEMKDSEEEAAALSTMLCSLGSCLSRSETFKRLSVSFSDSVYYALIIGQFQVIYRALQ